MLWDGLEGLKDRRDGIEEVLRTSADGFEVKLLEKRGHVGLLRERETNATWTWTWTWTCSICYSSSRQKCGGSGGGGGSC
jgi:hypothetical protein